MTPSTERKVISDINALKVAVAEQDKEVLRIWKAVNLIRDALDALNPVEKAEVQKPKAKK